MKIKLKATELELIRQALAAYGPIRGTLRGSDIDQFFDRVMDAEIEAKSRAGWLSRCDDCGFPLPLWKWLPPHSVDGERKRPFCKKCGRSR